MKLHLIFLFLGFTSLNSFADNNMQQRGTFEFKTLSYVGQPENSGNISLFLEIKGKGSIKIQDMTGANQYGFAVNDSNANINIKIPTTHANHDNCRLVALNAMSGMSKLSVYFHNLSYSSVNNTYEVQVPTYVANQLNTYSYGACGLIRN